MHNDINQADLNEKTQLQQTIRPHLEQLQPAFGFRFFANHLTQTIEKAADIEIEPDVIV